MLFHHWFGTKKNPSDSPKEKKLWFKRKWYGWGWYPVTWQGWAVVGIYVGLVAVILVNIDLYHGAKEIFSNVVLTIVILTGFLIYICYKKGETPKWQWGKKEEKSKDSPEKP